jgi:NADH dehydrogenase (ubiquinone) 1 beta subcomplex subunit 10
VEPNRRDYNWYHQQFRRVPNIDECYIDDKVCIYEADQQFKRDRLVDSQILNILRLRMDDCVKEGNNPYSII